MHLEKASAIKQRQYNRWEYQLWAQPGDGLLETLQELQQTVAASYGHTAPEEKPRLFIMQFFAKEEMEETLIRWIHNICRLQKSFTVVLNNFSAAPPCTLFLRIQNPEAVTRLACQFSMLDGFMDANDCLPVQLVAHPRLVVAEHLEGAVFERVVSDFAARSCHETFKVEKLALLKRSTATERFKLVDRFALAQQNEEAMFYNQS